MAFAPQASAASPSTHREFGHDQRPVGSLPVDSVFKHAVARSKSGTEFASEAAMQNEFHYPFGEAVWGAAGVILLLAFGDVLVVLALALVIAGVIAAFWSYRQVRREEHGGDLAPVTQIRPAAAVRRAPTTSPIHGPSAA
jgi:hypothetical protein